MTPDRGRVEELFERALELPRDVRERWLKERCREEPELREAVRALLLAHERAGGILEATVPAAADMIPRMPAVPRPERVGPYRVLDEIGRGGMGVVYLAERDDGQFRRRVALKLIRGAPDEELLERILAERQILASLDHPNIAKLLDGGVTESGLPYLVMEHVSGLPIDVYCDRMRLTVRERLALFNTVARAVDHAHRNLVVHRDLKPSNILVTTDGRVKLLDFGIAKLMNPSLAGVASPVTRTERRVLTPEYASPEQLRGEALSTSTDVYSLGVVLYRLLTGRHPYRLREASMPAVLTAVMESDPTRPSARILESQEAPTAESQAAHLASTDVASARQSTPDRLRRALRGDLDAIVLKALRKEPTQRYGSAEALAEDLERYLEGEAVLAHRGSRWYRLSKFARRNRAAVMAAGLAAISLLFGAGTATWQAGVASRERDRAHFARGEAETALRQSEEVSGFLMELFSGGDPTTSPQEVTARDLLDRGVQRADELSDQPLVQARLLDVIGQMYHRLARTDEAEALLRRALELRRAQLGPAHPHVAESMLHLARVLRGSGGARAEETRSLVEGALRIRLASYGESHPAVAEAFADLGWISTGAVQESMYRRAITIYRASGEERETVHLLQQLSTNLRRQGRHEESETTDREALAKAEQLFGPESPEAGYAMVHLADHVRDFRRDYAEAERLYERGLELQIRHYGHNSLHLIHGLHSLGWMLSHDGRHEEAERLFRHALAIRTAATGAENPWVAREMDLLAGALLRQGRLDEAETTAREALALHERTVGTRRMVYAGSLRGLAEIMAALGRWDEFDRLYLRAEQITRDIEGEPSIAVGELLRHWGRLHAEGGHFTRSEPLLLRALSNLERAYADSPEHPNLVDARRALQELYTAWNRPDEAARYPAPPGEFVAY